MLKPGRTKEGRVEEKLNKDAHKGYESRIPGEMCDRSTFSYQGEIGSGDLNVFS